MAGTLLVVNAGSSSIKFQLFALGDGDRLELAFRGQLDGIGTRPRLLAKDAAKATLTDQAYEATKVAYVPAT